MQRKTGKQKSIRTRLYETSEWKNGEHNNGELDWRWFAKRFFFIFKIYFFIWQDNDDDSEAEKLSPLLNNKIVKIPIKKALNNSIQMDELDAHVEDSEGTAINLSLKKVRFF